jgi:hypothetical protein
MRGYQLCEEFYDIPPDMAAFVFQAAHTKLANTLPSLREFSGKTLTLERWMRGQTSAVASKLGKAGFDSKG